MSVVKQLLFLSFLALGTAHGAGRVKISPLLYCLAQEEEKIHRGKVSGPIVALNKELLSDFTAVEHLLLRPKFYRQICHPQAPFSPSLGLVKLILTNRDGIFISTSKDSSYRRVQADFIRRLPSRIGRLFMDYLSGLQGLAPKANCLEEHIPPLGKIYRKYQIIEQDVGIRQLLAASDVNKIFRQLKRLEQIIQACR